MRSHTILESELLAKYRSIRQDIAPSWAVHKRNSDELVVPTIPFVGRNYSQQPKKILVYASAENLSKYSKGNNVHWVGDWLDDDEQAENRHRKCFEDREFQYDPFFPHVHLGPMNDGFLATAAYYIANRLLDFECETPREFYDAIAFGNYGKFSIETEYQAGLRMGSEKRGGKENIDYAENAVMLGVSHDFVKADLEVLEPDVIVLPKSVYWTDQVFIEEHRGKAVIVPISQINARVINCHIKKRYPCCDVDNLSASVHAWYNSLVSGRKTKTKDNYLSVFSYLDYVLSNELR